MISAQPPSPKLSTYEQWLREAFAAAQRGDQLGLEQSAARLVETTNVRVDDNATVPVDNRWLREALDAPEPDLDRIATQLGALLDALALPDTLPPDDAQQQLQEILSRPPFATEQPRETLFSRFIDWLIRRLDWILRPAASVGSSPAMVVGWIFALLGTIFIVGLLIYFVANVRHSLSREVQITKKDPETNLTSAAAKQHAQTLARGGDYRSAVRYLYLSSLLLLDERGILRYDRALTNHEYLTRLENAKLQLLLQPVIETFDQVWYGYLPMDENAFVAYQKHVEALRSYG